MPLYEDIARSIVRKKRGQLEALPPEQRQAVVSSMIRQLSEKSDDELISSISTAPKEADPALQQRIDHIAAQNREMSVGIPAGQMQAVSAKLAKKQIHEQELQRLGVVTDQPLPESQGFVSSDVKAGFGAEPIEDATNILSQAFGKSVTVFPRGEDLLYIDPEDGAVKLVNISGLGAIGPGIVVGGDITGTIGGGIAGAALTKHPAGVIAFESAGSGAGVTITDFSRLLIGKLMGVHDKSLSEMLAKAGIKGAQAAAVTGAVGTAVAGIKGGHNFMKANIFKHEDALKHGLSTKKAQAIVNEVNEILGRKGVIGTAGKLADDPLVAASEAEIRKQVEHAAKFVERDAADQLGTKQALDKITSAGVDRQGTGLVGEVAGKQVGKRVTQAKGIVSRNQTELQTQLKNIGKTRKEMVGEPTRKILIEKRDAANRAIDNTWETIRKTNNYNKETKSFGIEVPVGENIAATKAILKRQAKTATTQPGKRAATEVFGSEEKKEALKGIVDVKGKIIRPFNNKKAADLADYNREISKLKKGRRAVSKNKQFTDPDIAALDDVISSLVADRRIALIKAGKGDLLKKIESAEAKTAKFHETFNRSVVGDLTAKSDKGVFNIKGKEFVDKTLAGSKEEADQLLQVIGDKPSLIAQWKEGIADSYKRKAFTENKFNKKASDQFLEGNADVLSKFFSKAELSSFKKTGQLADVVRKQTNQLKRIIKNADSVWGKGKLKSLDPNNLVKFVTNESGSWSRVFGLGGIQSSMKKIQYVKKITKNHPAAWREFQSDFAHGVRSKVLDPKTGNVNFTQINKLVDSSANQIVEIMGKQYYKNLVSISEMSKLLNKVPKSLSGNEFEKGVIQVLRGSVAPPLTRKGRMFTAALMFNKKRYHAVLSDAMLDPAKMAKIASLAEHKRLPREAIELAVSLGFIHE